MFKICGRCKRVTIRFSEECRACGFPGYFTAESVYGESLRSKFKVLFRWVFRLTF
jgi:hypothetical protein